MTDYNQYLSKTVVDLPPSGIRKFFDLAEQMENVISLGVGEPDFITPWRIRDEAIQALSDGYTSYTANAGLLELREEISKYMKRKFSLDYRPEDQIIVTIGASEALDIAFRALLNPGDEVLIIEPAFVAYPAVVTLAGGKAIRVATNGDNGFKVTPEQIEAAITEKTKAILLCSPNNPTGTFLNKDDLLELSEIVIKHDLLVVADEIYAELTYDEDYVSIATLPGMYERTIVINGFSKAFAMTGWRLGFVCGPQPLVGAMLKIHQYITMCAPNMLQHGAVEALRNGNEQVEEMKRSYKRRRNFLVQSLNEIGLDCHLPGGAFYVFPSIQNTGLTSEEFAEELLKKERVAVVPGNAFGTCGEGYIRCSYATSLEKLQEAVTRIERFLQSLGIKKETAVAEKV